MLLLISITSFGADTLRLSFISSNGSISEQHAKSIIDFIDNRRVEQAAILSIIDNNGNISRNRIHAEQRLFRVRNQLLNLGVPFNHVQGKLKIKEANSSQEGVIIGFVFKERNGDRVLRKTALLQVSKVHFEKEVSKETIKPALTEKRIEGFSILDTASFKKNELVKLSNLLFHPGTFMFLSETEGILFELLALMKTKPNLVIELQGHICCKVGGGDTEESLTRTGGLSENRARAVYYFLIRGGIKEGRLAYRGFGSSKKLYPEERTEWEKKQNRRVEVLVLED